MVVVSSILVNLLPPVADVRHTYLCKVARKLLGFGKQRLLTRMGSSEDSPSQEAEPANAVQELRAEDQKNTSASNVAVKPSPAASDAAIVPRASDTAVEQCPGSSDAAIAPSTSDAAIDTSSSGAAIQLCTNASDAAVGVCPGASEAATGQCPGRSDAATAPRPAASNGAIAPSPSTSDAAIDPSPSGTAKKLCPSASDDTIEVCPEAATGQCPDAVPEKPLTYAGDPNRRRWAKVRLYTHALCGMGVAGAAASLSLPMILHCVSSQLLKHWCLIVRFLDEPDRDRIWLCDFGSSLRFKLASAGAWHPRKGERINYVARPVSKQALFKGKLMERKFYLGTIQISENELRAVCASMRHNGKKYHPLTRNCQDCSKDLCRRLGLSAYAANDLLLVLLCPPVALLTELAGSAYNAATKYAASRSQK